MCCSMCTNRTLHFSQDHTPPNVTTAHIHVHVHVHAHGHGHVHAHVHAHVHVHMYMLCMCMCTYRETKGSSNPNRSWWRETLAPKARSSACLHLLSRAGNGHRLLSRFSSPHSLPLCSLSPSSLFGIPLLALLVVLGVTLADLFILTILLSFDPGLRHNFDWHRGRVRGGSFRTVWHRTSK